jgi:hypothetical protein
MVKPDLIVALNGWLESSSTLRQALKRPEMA